MSSNKRKKRYDAPSKDEREKPKKKPKRLPKGKLKDDLKRWEQTDWEKYSDDI